MRPATLDDAAALAELMSELGYPTSAAEMRERLTHLLAHPDYHAAVATDAGADGAVLGMIGLARGWFFERNGAYARILALVVAQEHRGAGIGSALVSWGEEWAREIGASAILVNSGLHRPDAHRFYTRLGYERSGFRFSKRLGEGPGRAG